MQASYFIVVISVTIVLAKISNAQNANDTHNKPVSQYLPPEKYLIKFQYCVASGYHQHFQLSGDHIAKKYPDVEIVGESFHPPLYKTAITKIMSALKMLLIVCFAANVNLIERTRLGKTKCWRWAFKNKIFSCSVTFVVFEILERYILTTGAFEVFLNDIPLWSALETGKLPQPQELIKIIDSLITSSEEDQLT